MLYVYLVAIPSVVAERLSRLWNKRVTKAGCVLTHSLSLPLFKS
jgi:hypothetical protein